jgi:para-nitrobenzyl esterase
MKIPALWGRIAIVALLVFALMSDAQVLTGIGPINTQSGIVAGEVLASGVKAWLGVPFAKPPVRDLRWAPPQPVRWRGTWNADRKMPECIQVLRPHMINHYFGEEATSEDCLYLNIWAPPGSTSHSQLPVVVFIYGGGFTIGSSGSALYDGEQIARHGAVFVNLNYRLGILGFMAHPELTREQNGHSGNYGFLDQNAALHWIHDNIAQFGGNPSQVLIIGQSAGAGSVSAQIFSPLAKGLFQSAVMSSGCSWGASGTPLSTGESIGLQIQKALHADNLAAMRQMPADRVLALQAENQVMANSPGIRTSAVIDGYFTPEPQMQMLKGRRINDVPIIASSNQDDLDSNSSPLTKARTVTEYEDAARQLYGANADEFLKLYPVMDASQIAEVAHRAARDSGMQASARQCAELMHQYTSSAAYIDLFTHKHPYAPGVKIADQDPATIGAYHTSDIPYWFGTLDAFNLFRQTRIWTEADRHLSEEMMAALIHFAATGSPSTSAVNWPAWSPDHEQRLEWDLNPRVQPLDVTRMDWLASHMPARPAPFGPEPGRVRD